MGLNESVLAALCGTGASAAGNGRSEDNGERDSQRLTLTRNVNSLCAAAVLATAGDHNTVNRDGVRVGACAFLELQELFVKADQAHMPAEQKKSASTGNGTAFVQYPRQDSNL